MPPKESENSILKFLKEKGLEYFLSVVILGGTVWISEPKSLDLRFKFRGEIPADPRLVLIDIHDESSSLRPPWNLAELEKLLRPVLERHPAAVGIDLRFDGRPQNYEGNLQAFVDSLAGFSVPIVLSVAFSDDQLLKPELQSIPANVYFGSATLIDPYYPESDNVVRRVRLLNENDRESRPIYAFLLLLFAAAKGIDPMQCLAELAASGLSGSPDEHHLISYANNYRHALSRFAGPQPDHHVVDKFTSFSARALLEQGHAPEWNAQLTRQIHDSTIVLVGATYQDLTSTDWFRTPLSWKETISGVVVHANILNWLLRRSFISEPGRLLTFFMALGLIILSWLVIHFMEFKKAVLILVLVFLMYGMAAFILFASWEVWLPLIWPLRVAIYFVLLLGVLAAILAKQRKRKLKRKLNWLMPYSG
jgi:CHASE2 domain-containing sensor protein